MKPSFDFRRFFTRFDSIFHIAALTLLAMLLAVSAYLSVQWAGSGWRGILWLPPLIGLLIVILWWQRRPRQSETRGETVRGALIDSVIILDRHGKIIDINEDSAKVFGYSPTEVLDENIDLLIPGTSGESGEQLGASDSSKSGVRLEVSCRHKNGSKFAANLVLEINGSGAPAGFTALVCDLSDHEHMDRELVEHFQLLEGVIAKRTALLDRSESIAHIGHWDWDLISDKIYWSDELHRILGREPGNMVTSYEAYLNNIVHPEDRGKSARAYALAMRDPEATYRGNHRILLPTGEERLVYERAEVDRDNNGKVQRVTGIVQDINNQPRSENGLEQTASSGIQAEQVAEIGHFLYDEIAERYLYASPGCAKIYGRSEAEFLNHYASEADDLADIHDRDRKRVENAYNHYAATGEDCKTEFRVRRPDGEYRWVRELLVAHQMKGGEVALSRGVLQDITEQKNIEIELREAKQDLEIKVQERTSELAESEERFKLAMLGSNDGLWDWNLETDEVHFSRRWFEMLGYGEQDLPGTVETWQSLVNPADKTKILELVEAVINGETSEFKTEFSMRHRDGRWVPILSRAAVQRDPDTGAPARLVGTHVDLSEQRAAAEALEASEARFRSLVDNIPGVVYSRDLDNIDKLTYISDYIEKMTDYPASDFIDGGELVYDEIVHPDDRLMVQTAKQEGIATSGHFEIEYRIVDRHGDLHWVWERGQIIRDPGGKAMYLDGFVYEISERVLAEQALKKINAELDERIRKRTAELDQSKKVALSLMHDARREKERAETGYQRLRETTAEIQKLQQAVEQSPISIVITDTNGIIEYANAYASEISQYEASDLVGSHSTIFRSHVHDDDFYRNLDEHFASGVNWTGELCNRKKDGSLYWESVSICPVHDSEGELINTVLVKLDITEQREMQDALIQAKEQAEAANRAKSSFLAMMSHEIRTPMNGIIGMIDLLGQTSLSNKQQKFMRTAQESALSLLQIINDILDFSKIEAGHMEVESIPVAWKTVVEDVADLLTPSLLEKQLQLYCTVDANLPQWVSGDPGRLRQILTNLLSNAIKFTATTSGRTGEIKMRVESDDSSGERKVRLEITDNGIGMSPQQVKELFQPFVQADSSTHRRFGGSGLGLSICARLAKIMGGEIGCSSEAGLGSKFWVLLPCHAVESPTGEAFEADLSGLNILLFGDHPVLEIDLEPYLSARGASVTRLTDHTRAVETAVDNRPDVVLLSADWPQQTRVSLYESFRQNDCLQECRFVVPGSDTGFNSAAGFTNCIQARSNPFVVSEICQSIAVAAGRAESVAAEEIDNIETTVDLPKPDEAEANGTLILIVEDNQTNQEVIHHQLNLLGYVAEVAGNGLEALKRMESRRYGLLLTDCNMPEMDGYELTVTIRESELDKESRLPIIAITANALLGESDRCLAVGMDDYISKPVQLGKLRKTLRRWLPLETAREKKISTTEEHKSDKRSEKTGPDQSSSTRETIPNSVIDHSLLAKFLGDDEKIQEMFLHKFVTQSESVIKAVDTAVTSEEWAEVGAQAHKLKSSSRSVGAVKLADLCAELEQAGKRADANAIKALSPKLGEAYGQVREYVKQRH